MDAQHQHHRRFLKALKRNVVASADFQRHLLRMRIIGA
jgi:hypothetical protein